MTADTATGMSEQARPEEWSVTLLNCDVEIAWLTIEDLHGMTQGSFKALPAFGQVEDRFQKTAVQGSKKFFHLRYDRDTDKSLDLRVRLAEDHLVKLQHFSVDAWRRSYSYTFVPKT